MRARQWMQVAAVASAVGLAGSAMANDTDRTIMLNSDLAAPVTRTTPSPSAADSAAINGAMNESAARGTAEQTDSLGLPDTNVRDSMNRSAGTAYGNDSATSNGNSAFDNDTRLNDDSTLNDNTAGAVGVAPRGALASPGTGNPNDGTLTGGESSATALGANNRTGNFNSDNFDAWMSDYATAHNGRITRQEFLDQMGNRWDVIDVQRQGYLTPGEARGIYMPGENATPALTGSQVRPGDMGPGNSKGE